MDKISIIVPVWNAENFLNKCVNSIRNQTYKNLEIILVDDGSSDSSYELCLKYAEQDERIVVYHKENGGQASARNFAIEHATGNFIGFVDDDDWIYPEMYEKLHKYLLEFNADVARCDDCSDEAEEPIREIKLKITEKEEFFGMLFQDIWGGHVTDRLFKREVVGQSRFPYSKTIEDMRFMRSLLPKINKEVSTSEKLYFYTIRDDSTSFVYAKNYVNSYERALEFQDRYQEAKKLYPQYSRLLLCKATTFSCGTIRILWRNRIKYNKEYKKMLKFLKDNKKFIFATREIGIKYKLLTLFL